jgi:hypothetical protein
MSGVTGARAWRLRGSEQEELEVIAETVRVSGAVCMCMCSSLRSARPLLRQHQLGMHAAG